MALYLSNLVYDSRSLLFILKGILLPGDAMRDHSTIMQLNWQSTSSYLPLFGLSFVITFLKNNKTWMKNLLCILLIISLSPLMQSGFLLFTAVYQRWWYMMILIMALATVKVLEEPEKYHPSKGVWIYVAIVKIFCFCIKHIPWNSNNEQMIFHIDRFAYFYVIAIAGPVILNFVQRIKIKYFGYYNIILCLTMFFCVLTTALTLHYYRIGTNSQSYIKDYEIYTQLEPIDDQYRYSTSDNLHTLTGRAAGYGAFSSRWKTLHIGSMAYLTLK